MALRPMRVHRHQMIHLSVRLNELVLFSVALVVKRLLDVLLHEAKPGHPVRHGHLHAA